MAENWSAERVIGPNESYVGSRLLFRSGNQVEANLIAPNLTLAGQLLRRAFMFGFLAFVLVSFVVGCLGMLQSSSTYGDPYAEAAEALWLAFILGVLASWVAFMGSLFSRHPELVSEWHLVIDGQAPLAESAYAALYDNLIHRRRAPVSGKVRRIRNRHAFNQESWHLVIADGQWGMYVSAFGYGGDLYLGWQLWRHQLAIGLVSAYFKAQFKPPYQDIPTALEADRVRAMRDAVHNAFRAAIEEIAAGHQRSFDQVYGQPVRVEDPDAAAAMSGIGGPPAPAYQPAWPPAQATPPHQVSGPPANALPLDDGPQDQEPGR